MTPIHTLAVIVGSVYVLGTILIKPLKNKTMKKFYPAIVAIAFPTVIYFINSLFF